MKHLTAIDLFAGIGGIRLGLEQAGFKVIYSNDCDKYCNITFENYFGESLDTRKIEDVPLSDIPNSIDLLTAGFPCQPFSLAGLKKGFDDPRGSLFDKVAEIIDDKKPRAFLLENVKHLKSHNRGETLKYILDILRNRLNYFVPEPQILNSKYFGVPQNRQRIYIVGFRDKEDFNRFKYPEVNAEVPKLESILEKGVEDEFYFLSQKYLDGLIEHKNRHKGKGNGFGLEILDPEGISNTLVVGNMGRERNLIEDHSSKVAFLKNDKGIRKLTIRECARLQGFPENFSFDFVSKTQAYKQLGNTISVPVLQAISTNIINAFSRELKPAKIKNKIHIEKNSYLNYSSSV